MFILLMYIPDMILLMFLCLKDFNTNITWTPTPVCVDILNMVVLVLSMFTPNGNLQYDY